MDADAVTLGLDLGTGSVKVVALDAAGGVVAKVDSPVDTTAPEPGAAEQCLDQIWAATCTVLQAVAGRQIASLGISGAMHSIAAIDASGRVLGRATTWADRRCARDADDLAEALVDADSFYARTGCPFGPLYHPARLRWWRRRRPEARRFAAICDCITHRLTGRWAANLSVSSASGLLDTHRLGYDERALALAGVTREVLLPLSGTHERLGQLEPAAARATGLPEGLTVVTGASDGALANLAADPGRTGRLVITVGTSAAVRRITDQPRFDARRRTWCYVLDGEHHLVGAAMNNGGEALLHVAREHFGGDVARAEAAAAQAHPDCGGIAVLPFLHGERGLIWPHDAHWVVEGPARSRTPANLARATMVGVANAIACLVEPIAAEAAEALLTGGITRSKLWSQMLADATGLTLRPLDAGDASAVGAARVAARSVGRMPPHTVEPSAPVHPRDDGEAAQQHLERFRDLCRSRRWMS